MPQHSIRFSDELYAAVEAEARRRGHPHTFSSVVVNALQDLLRPGHAKPFPGPEKKQPSNFGRLQGVEPKQ